MELKRLTFYLDFISPYAYLAFERLPQALEGISHAVTYQPVLFASMLKAHGNIGPAAIPVTLAGVQDSLKPGDGVMFQGMGSGINAALIASEKGKGLKASITISILMNWSGYLIKNT